MQLNRKDLIREIKESSSLKNAYLNSIDIDKNNLLLPVCRAHLSDKELIKLLTNWRNKNVNVYPTQFKATEESTYKWFKDVLLKDESRILFLVLNSYGDINGHIGLAKVDNISTALEIDNVIKGNQLAEKGLFSKALTKLMEWSYEILLVEKIQLRVFSDNEHAINFYSKNFFFLKEKLPLKKTLKDNIVSFLEIKNNEKPDKFFFLMEHKGTYKRYEDKLLLTAGPSISQLETNYAFDAAGSGWNSKWSQYLNKLEKEFAEYIGVKHAIATSSCTGALHIALLALNIGEGDEVIVPDQTWVATANAVKYTGAKPVFADINLNSWNLEPTGIKELITSKTKAIIPVHMYGNPANMAEINKIAQEMNLYVVEDAAPSIGAEFNGKKTGSFGDFGAFSFQGAKLMVTGEGGMLVTNNTDLYEKALKIWDQGRNPNASRAFWIDTYGVKYKMSNIQAAVGLGQLRRVNLLIDAKRRIFKKYQEFIKDIECLNFIEEYPNSKSICWMTSFSLNNNAPISRDKLIEELRKNGVDSRPVFPAISQYPIWGEKNAPKVNALCIGDNGINLPSGVCLKNFEIEYVCDVIRKLLT
ncbi:DegT/DnrJ/EryC1/StrS family aminotransferase [Prochlorococcus sp. AH-716-P05]|nr:DegT/DnrJ/EryC1/StrS family aminotransferase [Prochlorococcus sp. AH-716-P05]